MSTPSLQQVQNVLFKECSYYCELISNPKQFSRVLHIATQNAVGRLGKLVLAGHIDEVVDTIETNVRHISEF